MRMGRSAESLGSAKARCMVMARSNALLVEEKEGMNLSPIVFTSEPPWDFSASRTMRLCSRSNSRALACPSRRVSAVEPSTSVCTQIR